MNDWEHDDSRLPTEQERRKFCELLYRALLDLRLLCLRGQAQQAADLADAFHELPALLWSETFSPALFRKYLEGYEQKYPGADFKYVSMFDNLFRAEGR
ncbi:MAG TPA: hypothetical protein VGB98_16225 [Pyrinomonadaceae bacterium]